jgi:tetratricopeptide (TPR) repeat protein
MIFFTHIPFLHSSRKGFFLFLFFSAFFFISGSLNAQWAYEIDGTVTTGNRKLDGAIVTLYKGSTQTQQITTTSSGKFSLNLDQEAEYTMTVTKPGFITKKFIFSTRGVPGDVAKNYEGGAKPEISIFELPKDPAVIAQVNSILAQPVAKFLYDPTEQDIVFDKAYSESMLQELNRLNQLEKEVKKKQEEEAKNLQASSAAAESKYNAAISKGDAAFSKKDFTTAKASYQDALTIKKGEAYPVGKLVEIDKLLADAAKNAQVEADYKAAIAKADQALGSKNYDVAKGSYTDALKLKPSENYPKSKLDEIAKLLANESKNKELDAKYNAAIAAADKAFASKTYDAAKTSYSEALALKSGEKYPKSQLAEIERIQNELNAKNKSAAELMEKYKAAIAKADKALAAKDYSGAKNFYKDASALQPSESYPKDKIAEIDKLLGELANKDAAEKDRLAKEKELNAKYEALISKADKAFASKDYPNAKASYNEALSLKSAEQYPKGKLTEIDQLMAAMASKDAAEKERLAKESELNSKYNAAIASGDKAMAGKDYATAKSAYTEASGLKSNEKYPKSKLEEIEKILASAGELDAKYKAAIAKADAALKAKGYDEAKKSYKDALSYKGNEQYPKDRLAEIEGLLAKEAGIKELDSKYNAIIAKADKAFSGKEYAEAKSGYNEALSVKPAETYPKTRLAEIDKLLADAAKNAADKERLAKEKELNDKYLAVIAKADKAFGNKEYSGAKTIYNEALSVKPGETYPKTKIAEIDKLLAEMASKEAAEKDRLAKEKAANEKYAAVIAKADAAFNTKDYNAAKSSYTEAYGIKPSEQYPKDKLQAIDALLSAAAKEQDAKYKALITKADAAYTTKDYASAKSAYTEATAVKPAEAYPKEQISKIDMLVAEAGKEKELKAKYTTAIAQGDAAMQKKDYTAALTSYKEAQALKPSEPYPNNKISEVNNILDGLARSKEKDKQYTDVVAKADKLFAAKDYKQAKASYLDASLLKPTERYPKEKVTEIDNILNPKTVVPVASTKSKDDFRNELAKKYPQGVTEESTTEGNLKVLRRIVVRGDEAHLYLKKTTSFGAVYYFKDDVSITEAEFNKDTGK